MSRENNVKGLKNLFIESNLEETDKIREFIAEFDVSAAQRLHAKWLAIQYLNWELQRQEEKKKLKKRNP